MPPPEKFPRRKRMHEMHTRLENVTRIRPTTRAGMAEKPDANAVRRQKDAHHTLQAVEEDRDGYGHGDDGGGGGGGGGGHHHRVSLPAKATRFGHIFGNMRVSEKVKAGEKLKATVVKAKPLFSLAAQEKFPERIQRFLQEPSLVSFNPPPDELAWVDRKSISEGGVSERFPAARPSPDFLKSPRRRSQRPPTQPVLEDESPSPHPSQQSTQVKRLKTAAVVMEKCPLSVASPMFVSRGCSPIVVYLADDYEMSQNTHRRRHRSSRREVRNESVQTGDMATSPVRSDDGSLNRSVRLDLPASPEVRYDLNPDNRERIYRGIAEEDKRKEKAAREELLDQMPWNLQDQAPERVIMANGEVAYLIRPKTTAEPGFYELNQ
ncbi:hypothetical protein BV898_06101 [Hypsibius exemplaris]|uniref:Uncharacterized protein n=1 Tax=Hypsibius exemplaris TaxID=2072580 RepID=A0A1W0WX95_HYPEX|nr:hypothetical protein BV898_06101 [Hypsibius exemplaris]